MTNPTRDRGLIDFLLEHQDEDWLTNERGYRFTEARTPHTFDVIKTSDGNLVLMVRGPFDRGFVLTIPLAEIPPSPPGTNGVIVEIAWANRELTISLNQVVTETIEIDDVTESARLKQIVH